MSSSDQAFEGALAFFGQMHPELPGLFSAVREIAWYDISDDQAEPFMRFHKFITDPTLSYVTKWRLDPKLEGRWYIPHVDGVLSAVRGGLAATHYHAERLIELESQIVARLKAVNMASFVGPNSAIGFGGTRKLDFEYHAFILSYRRTLDYLATALAAYFRTQGGSYRTLPVTLRRKRPERVSEALTACHERHADALGFILQEGPTGVRNRVAHFDFVSAGTFNINARGIFFAGAGEGLGPREPSLHPRVAEILVERIERLHLCVNDMLHTFVDAASRMEAET